MTRPLAFLYRLWVHLRPVDLLQEFEAARPANQPTVVPDVVATPSAVDEPPVERIGRWPLDVPFPATLRDTELMQVTGHGSSWFYVLKKQGVFRFLEMRPQLAKGGTLYSGHLVRQWSRGELGSSKYFQSAAKRGADVAPIAGRRPPRPRRTSAEAHAPQSDPGHPVGATHEMGERR